MSAKARKKSPPFEVSIVEGPTLWQFEFVREEVPLPSSGDIQAKVGFSVALARMSRERLGVQMSLKVDDVPGLHVLVAFRTVFELGPASREDEEIEKEMRVVGAQLGPVVMYPYHREVIASAAQKAGLPPFVPPIMNFTGIFKPESLKVPPVPKPEAKKQEASE